MMTNVWTPRIVARPGGEQLRERPLGLHRDAEPAADEQHERDDDRDRAEQPELLADRGEDEVGRRDGDQRRAAEPEPGALEPAAAERVEALHELVALVLRGPTTG